MLRACRIAAFVAIILTALPAAAAAASQPSSPVALASSIASRYWGATPCRGQIKVLVGQPVPAVLEHDSDAWVTFRSSLGVNNLAAPAASYTGCTIALGRTRWPTTETIRQDWDMLCMTITHEYGHLLGRSHNTAPGNVMNPVFTSYGDEPQLCRSNRPRGSGS
jgi:hypothetical protein